jgi:hypothetical protein
MNKSSLKTVTSSKNHNWNTPRVILDPINEHFGVIELDPCSNPTSLVGATKTFSGPTIDQDGLVTPWADIGLTYVNPPYGRAVGAWTKKVALEAAKGKEIILLVPARTDAKWFQELAKSQPTVLFWKGRLKFEGAPASAPFPSCVFYWGPRKYLFGRAFEGKGIMVDL